MQSDVRWLFATALNPLRTRTSNDSSKRRRSNSRGNTLRKSKGCSLSTAGDRTGGCQTGASRDEIVPRTRPQGPARAIPRLDSIDELERAHRRIDNIV